MSWSSASHLCMMRLCNIQVGRTLGSNSSKVQIIKLEVVFFSHSHLVEAVNVVSNFYSIVPALVLIHCQPDSHETPFIQCFCLSGSPFTSFPAIVLTWAGQQSEVCINGEPRIGVTHTSACIVLVFCLLFNCSVNCVVYFQLLPYTPEARVSEEQKTRHKTNLELKLQSIIVIQFLTLRLTITTTTTKHVHFSLMTADYLV